MKTTLIGVSLAVLIGASCFVLSLFGRGEGNSSSSAAENTVAYLCSETGRLIVAPLGPTPALNPATGRRTLVRAMYCAECAKWYAAPPSDVSGGNPQNIRCPKHNTPLSMKGPLNEAGSGAPQHERSP